MCSCPLSLKLPLYIIILCKSYPIVKSHQKSPRISFILWELDPLSSDDCRGMPPAKFGYIFRPAVTFGHVPVYLQEQIFRAAVLCCQASKKTFKCVDHDYNILSFVSEPVPFSGLRKRDPSLLLVLSVSVLVGYLALLVAFEKEYLCHTFVGVNLGRQRGGI